jgi:hypothetical protein
MSSDLLAEFDSFYRSPQDTPPNPTSASNDLSFLGETSHYGQAVQGNAFPQWQNPAPKPNEDIWGSMTSFPAGTNAHQASPPHDDIWGSFEASTNTQMEPPQAFNMPKSNHGVVPQNTRQNKPGVLRRSTLDLFSSNPADHPEPPQRKFDIKAERFPPRPAAVSKGSFGEVLFDADELSAEQEDDDEFGEFETVTTTEPLAPPPQSQSLDGLFGATSLDSKPTKTPINLLSTSTNLNAGTLPYPQAPKSPSFQERNPFAQLGLATSQILAVKKGDKPKSASPVTAWPTFEPKNPKPDPYEDSPAPNNQDDEEWGDFADLPPETPAVEPTKRASDIQADAWSWDAADQISDRAPPSVDVAPPMNVPPPSVLLTLFPPLFDLPQSTLFKVVANQQFSLKNRILSDPSTIDFLRGYLLIATVAARIIAGRKLRWKRDNFLSQAMKIGPAARGGKGGMKLAGVDRAEITREDQEAADAIRVWRDYLGRLRSAIAVANSSMRDNSSHLTIPELSENLHIKTQEGAMTAQKPCVICGLKREERISKVDIQVEDSFGEWWTEHWGHRACRNFWQEHESKLKHR